MKALGIVLEAARAAIAQPVASVVTGLIVAAVCGVILATTGQSVQAERQVLAQIDAAGTRSIVITDVQGDAGLKPSAIDRISGLSGVEWVIGLGPAQDVWAVGNPEGNVAAVRAFFGELPSAIRVSGADLSPGHVWVGPEAQAMLGLIHPYGGLAGAQVGEVSAVGAFDADDPLAFLDRTVLTVPAKEETVLVSIHVLAENPSLVGSVAAAAVTVLGADDPGALRLETSGKLAEIRAAVRGELGRFGRQLVAVTLAVGLVLAALNVYGAVTTRRRDFGRRRALGASRPLIVGLVAVQTVLVALIGALVGIAGVGAVLTRLTGTAPDPVFSAAVGVLAILTTAVAAIPPALVAAYRDPVRVLRIP